MSRITLLTQANSALSMSLNEGLILDGAQLRVIAVERKYTWGKQGGNLHLHAGLDGGAEGRALLLLGRALVRDHTRLEGQPAHAAVG